MCGIFGYLQGLEPEDNNPVDEVHKGIRRLVYRGYDSWGYATTNGYTSKQVGEVPSKSFGISEDEGKCEGAISHTRWATHGGVTERNAHPHNSCDNCFAVVHNGIIENHEHFKEQLKPQHRFKSQTDTEVIPHFIEHHVDAGRTPAEALNLFDEEAQGNYAIVVLDREENQMYGLKQGSPLVFAFPRTDTEPLPHPKGAYFASDLYAISDKCEKAYFMEDGDLIMTSGDNLALWENGEIQEGFKNSNWKNFEWTEEEPVLGEEYSYWMEKEIKEQPQAMKRLRNYLEKGNEGYEKGKKLRTKIENADKVLFTASGTSYHATLLGVYYLQQQGINAQTLIASEFENYHRIDEDTLVIAVSQSGETRDVLDAIHEAQSEGAEIASLVNIPHSTIQRESDITLEIKAGQEIAVASTKTFANQVYALMHLAGKENLENIPEDLENVMESIETNAKRDAEFRYEAGDEDYYIIGESNTYPLAREIALKLKEIAYIHAEGMMAGELKHGTLALIEEGTPVLALDNGTGDIETTVEEITSRGGNVSTLVAESREEEMVFRATTYGFFLALHWGILKDLPIDKPRNLAKSVTVK